MSYAQCTTETTFETRSWYEPYYPKNLNEPGEEWDGVLTIDPFEYPYNPREVQEGVNLPEPAHIAEFYRNMQATMSNLIGGKEATLKRAMMEKGGALTKGEIAWVGEQGEEYGSPVAGEIYSVDVPDVHCNTFFFGLGPTRCGRMGEKRFAVYADTKTTCTYVSGITPTPMPKELEATGMADVIGAAGAFELDVLDLLYLFETLRDVAIYSDDPDTISYEDIMAYGEDPRHPLELGAYKMTLYNDGGSFQVDDKRIQIKMGLWKAIEMSPMSPEGQEIAKALIAGYPHTVYGPGGEGSYAPGVILENATGLLRLQDTPEFHDTTLASSAVRFLARVEPGHEMLNGRLEYYEPYIPF